MAKTNTLLSSGIAALDARIGGFHEGRYYLLGGAPGSGKTTAALQFIGAGLEAGERCAILTQDDPIDLLSQGEFLGYDLASADENGRLVVLRYRLDFARNYARISDFHAIFRELERLMADAAPTRLVIDSILPFLDGGRVSDGALIAFQEFLERGPHTTLLVLPGSLANHHFIPIYDRLVAGVGGILDFELREGQARELSVRKIRQELNASDRFAFHIRPGAGIVEHVAFDRQDPLSPELQRRVVVLDPEAHLPAELRHEIRANYDLVTYDSIEAAFSELTTSRFGALIVSLDPLAPEPVLDLVTGLRRAGNGVPILLFSRHRGLRSSTRARALRAGADDLFTDALGPEEVLQRIALAQERGHRRPIVDAPLAPPTLQPRDGDGRFRALSEDELVAALAQQAVAPQAAFSVVRIWPTAAGAKQAWRMFVTQLRTGDGDLVAVLPSGQVALYLHNVRMSDVKRLIYRLATAHPGLVDVDSADILCFPSDRAALLEWVEGARSQTAGAR